MGSRGEYFKLPRGKCSVCQIEHSISHDKLIIPHGPVRHRCPGSYKPPLGYVPPAEELSALTLDKPLTLLQRRHAIAEFCRYTKEHEGMEANYRMIQAVEAALSALNP